jgi:hypothetical protein
VQYFSTPASKPADVGIEQQPHLLARLEIVPHISAHKKPMWLVRAALEDFHSYSRPSYSTPALRNKIRQDIFSRNNRQATWLTLDDAAACMADQPEPLLQAMDTTLREWATKELNGEKDAGTKQETKKVDASIKVPSGIKPQPQGPRKASGPIVGPNGVSRPQQPLQNQPQRTSMSAAGRPMLSKTKPTGASSNDAITLD